MQIDHVPVLYCRWDACFMLKAFGFSSQFCSGLCSGSYFYVHNVECCLSVIGQDEVA
jgi:hypothetical protein